MTTAVIRDVTEATFVAEVVEASRTRPVVVDFWAAWCGPCRQLSPMLERAAAQWAGQIDVVKVDVDQAPQLSRQLRIQGIPAVKAFAGGRLVAEFVGLQPQARIDQFFAALAPSEPDRLVARARALPPAEAEPLLRQALEQQADHPAAILAIAPLLADRGARDEALMLLERVPGDAEAVRLSARLRLSGGALDEAAIGALRARVEHGDGAACVELGRALAARGDFSEALETLIAGVRDPSSREDARVAVLEAFHVLGDGHALVRQFRPRLSAVLF
ncbi:MAG: tetratricopeptide repeat protein [Egibacteraceae bacterium]